ncbi:hypothetical protein [Litoribacter populi]|uniref:hypothetical protein n=1 Tax=Litoribacter populi TaxID=2598460 RepID=UPI001180D18D|nr:hypothetical protein [Litoribacter populi]
MSLLEQIKYLEKEISWSNIIYRNLSKTEKFKIFTTITITLLLFFIAFYFNYILPFFILSVGTITVAILLRKSQNRIVHPYQEEKYTESSIFRIRKKIIKEKLKKNNRLNKEKLIFLIEHCNMQIPKFRYTLFTNLLLLFLGVIIGRLIQDYQLFGIESISSYLIFIVIILFIFLIDSITIKDYFRYRHKKEKRLKIILIKIYQEKYLK